jgi:hypothetical protein
LIPVIKDIKRNYFSTLLALTMIFKPSVSMIRKEKTIDLKIWRFPELKMPSTNFMFLFFQMTIRVPTRISGTKKSRRNWMKKKKKKKNRPVNTISWYG